MKKVLITGANSYIGCHVENWLKSRDGEYEVHTADLKNKDWQKQSFAGYDTVFHVAGIAHVSADPRLKDMYFAVNRDLTIAAAKKAKEDGAKQFIFMSSIIVYGNSARVGKERWITASTRETPADFYGQSKLEAEQGICPLADENFKVAVLRPPMIYGRDSKGNYRKLSALAKKCPIFPNIPNTRSMLFVDNLCEFVRLLVDSGEGGTFYPQNKEYVTTTEMVKEIAACHNKKMHVTKAFNFLIYPAGRFLGIINKVFGSLAYEKGMSDYQNYAYCVVDFKESIRRTEE